MDIYHFFIGYYYFLMEHRTRNSILGPYAAFMYDYDYRKLYLHRQLNVLLSWKWNVEVRIYEYGA